MISIVEFEKERRSIFFYSKERGRRINCDYPFELQIFQEYNAVHKQNIEIDGIEYELVNSDNIERIRLGEQPVRRESQLYLPVRKELEQ